ncbi:hypothetical protein Nmel_000762, partial [Mimus melanotis]
MAAPIASPSGNKAVSMDEVEKHYCCSDTNLNGVALSCLSSLEEDLDSPDIDEPPHPSVPEDSWERVQKVEIKEGDWQIVLKFTVALVRYQRQGANPRHEPITYGEIKELCRAAKHHRRDSPYFNNIIWAVFTAHVLTLHNLKYVMTMLLSPTEYTLWEGGWKHILNQLLAEYANDPARAALTIDHRAGEEQYIQPDDQVINIPRQVLDEIKNMSRKALVQVPDDIEKQVWDEKAKNELLKSLAVSNANLECKKVLPSLPPEPEPTLLQMNEA